jgi:hypothetical protein
MADMYSCATVDRFLIVAFLYTGEHAQVRAKESLREARSSNCLQHYRKRIDVMLG